MAKPKIRFKGYTDDWEQRKFGDLGSVAMCKRIFKEQTSTDGDIPFYKIGTFGAEPDAFISRELFEEYRGKFQYPNIGDMLISASGTIGRTVEYKGEEAYFQDSNIVWFKHDDRVDNSFLKCIYEIVKWSGIEGSTIKRLYNDNFLKTEFSMPKVAEQQQIGMYFQSLDHLITLHQRKCEQTKKMKKYMLQKMFPQNGAKVPEIRFDGFTYDWEQRKFSELYARSSEKNDGSIGMDKNITVATMQFKNDVKVSTTEYLKTYYTFKLGDIAFEGHQSKEFRYGRFVENDIGNGIVSHIFAVFRPIQEYDLYFWKYAINNETLMQRILARSTKASTMMHDLVTNDFLNETFLVPSVKEQKQIGAFLNKLDNLITLHQRQTDFYKKISFYYISS